MGHLMTEDSRDLSIFLDRAVAGDGAALQELFNQCRDRLRRMVQFRMDRRLQGRFDPSDVLQEAFLEASQRFPEYCSNPSMPILLWLRFLVAERLTTLHRHHLGVQARDARREISLHNALLPSASSAALAAQLVGALTSPSEMALKLERAGQLQAALNEMDSMDREVLSLRHFEHLTRAETAQVLNISAAAASKRYLRALQRLRKFLVDGHQNFESQDHG